MRKVTRKHRTRIKTQASYLSGLGRHSLLRQVPCRKAPFHRASQCCPVMAQFLKSITRPETTSCNQAHPQMQILSTSGYALLLLRHAWSIRRRKSSRISALIVLTSPQYFP
ncbi:hypothetical protein Micbo1qcDRAFT_158828 [Microdochium bolleyi]|uniref:Uncharacterized protein n=1 Tax=Microdochium bolleyi TaxID=196109 RepID=A0A136JA25_9PEZI|nr:hypothetical protein Micbo1qcDRAFT_158828 [Microdochium bolleyi]